jgi:hypothetical protein
MRPLTALLVTLGLFCAYLAWLPTSAFASDAQDAADMAYYLSELEANGQFNALYDLIHPDAHAIIPRAAVIGWYQNEFAPRGASPATITGVRFVSWTWAVTGKTYPRTAEVSFVQTFWDGGANIVLEDVVRLVRTDGEWRWFFGRSREFIEEQIALYVSAIPSTYSADLIGFVRGDLDAFWQQAFATASLGYTSPYLNVIERRVYTGCGAFDAQQTVAFYCQPDQTIYLDSTALAFIEQYGDFAVAFTIAHEWAHHIQALLGLVATSFPDEPGEFYSLEIELMADCFAGVWTLDADVRGLLDPGDLDEAILFALDLLGDAPGTSPYDDSAHGTSTQRVGAILAGYNDGFLGCEFILDR